MSGVFILGETKVRPGSYFNIQKKGDDSAPNIMNGVTAVIFRANFGPLNTVVELNVEDEEGYEKVFGTGLTTDAVREAIAGGAKTIIACRAGNGGTQGSVSLKDAEDEEALSITAKYPGDKDFSVTVREKLSDNALKECIFYTGTTELEKFRFSAGEGEAKALADALAVSKNFTADLKEGKDNVILADASQVTFEKGTNPQVTTDDYSKAFDQIEAYDFNTICVDTEEPGVHLMLQAFLNRIFEAGSLAQAVVAEKHTVDLEDRIKHAADFNDEKMNYVLNAWIDEQGREIDGYQTAARIAGMIGAVPANSSLTHTVINGFSDILERLTNTDITLAEKKGCIVLSLNKKKQVWIDNAINTLVTPADNQDEGWKKIRRVKTRFELIRRLSEVDDSLAGKVDNDKNGRETVLSQMQGVGNDMVTEEKLVSFTAKLSTLYTADMDSAWYEYDVIDKDSMEHIYGIFRFQFSTNQ